MGGKGTEGNEKAEPVPRESLGRRGVTRKGQDWLSLGESKSWTRPGQEKFADPASRMAWLHSRLCILAFLYPVSFLCYVFIIECDLLILDTYRVFCRVYLV